MVPNRAVLLPSKAFRKYKEFCLGTKSRPGWLLIHYGNIYYADPVEMTVDYYLPDYRWFPDVGNLVNGTCDLLQAAGIVENDSQIWSINAAISGIDKAYPRTELTLEVRRPEWWRDK